MWASKVLTLKFKTPGALIYRSYTDYHCWIQLRLFLAQIIQSVMTCGSWHKKIKILYCWEAFTVRLCQNMMWIIGLLSDGVKGRTSKSLFMQYILKSIWCFYISITYLPWSSTPASMTFHVHTLGFYPNFQLLTATSAVSNESSTAVTASFNQGDAVVTFCLCCHWRIQSEQLPSSAWMVHLHPICVLSPAPLRSIQLHCYLQFAHLL